MAQNRSIFVFFLLIVTTVIVSSGKVERGEACDDIDLFKLHPKFKGSKDKLRTCDGDKGLSCIESEDPAFKKLGQSNSNKVCDCTQEYYFDPVSKECRIQVGFACNPDQGNVKGDGSKWSDKCPDNGYCSTDLGRYGPRGAKGMCRCKEGFIVSSIWFVNGGGTVCESPVQRMRSGQNFMSREDYEFQEINSLAQQQLE